MSRSLYTVKEVKGRFVKVAPRRRGPVRSYELAWVRWGEPKEDEPPRIGEPVLVDWDRQ